jgi:hypothetical protein
MCAKFCGWKSYQTKVTANLLISMFIKIIWESYSYCWWKCDTSCFWNWITDHTYQPHVCASLKYQPHIDEIFSTYSMTIWNTTMKIAEFCFRAVSAKSYMVRVMHPLYFRVVSGESIEWRKLKWWVLKAKLVSGQYLKMSEEWVIIKCWVGERLEFLMKYVDLCVTVWEMLESWWPCEFDIECMSMLLSHVNLILSDCPID